MFEFSAALTDTNLVFEIKKEKKNAVIGCCAIYLQRRVDQEALERSSVELLGRVLVNVHLILFVNVEGCHVGSFFGQNKFYLKCKLAIRFVMKRVMKSHL